MIDTRHWAQQLIDRGYVFATGVPCSSLGPLQSIYMSAPAVTYLAAANEGQAVAIAAGAVAAGKKAVVLMQNSGLGNAVNPLTSLVEPFGVPILLVISWRGKPGTGDEPQHERMGVATHEMLDAMGIPTIDLSSIGQDAAAQLDAALQTLENGCRAVAIIVPDKTFQDVEATPRPIAVRKAGLFHDLKTHSPLSTRHEVLSWISRDGPKSTIRICTTGKTGRELFGLNDSPNNLYLVGSMGLASSLGLGLALSDPNNVLIIDGDGAALMHLGAMATIAAYANANLTHLILDNGRYDSTGGQQTVSGNVDFALVGSACGYAASYAVDSLAGLQKAIAEKNDGPTIVHMRIKSGSIENLQRPDKSPREILTRLQRHLGIDVSCGDL